MKTIILSLGVILAINSTAFATESLNKTQLIQALSSGGIPEGKQQGVSSEGSPCTLTISFKAGDEQVSMISDADEYEQRLLFDKEFESILFTITETADSIQINQDFDDSYQDVKIKKLSAKKAQATFIEYIAGDKRILTCTFEQK